MSTARKTSSRISHWRSADVEALPVAGGAEAALAAAAVLGPVRGCAGGVWNDRGGLCWSATVPSAPQRLRQLVRGCIEQHVDQHALEVQRQAEESERGIFRRLCEQLGQA
jgi:hypothetical protein